MASPERLELVGSRPTLAAATPAGQLQNRDSLINPEGNIQTLGISNIHEVKFCKRIYLVVDSLNVHQAFDRRPDPTWAIACHIESDRLLTKPSVCLLVTLQNQAVQRR